MDSSKDMKSAFDSFKSKKILHSSSESLPIDKPEKGPIESQWSSKTPEKSFNAPRRLRNRGAALSLKEVRQCAKKLQTRDLVTRTDQNISKDDKVSLEPIQSHVTKPKRSAKLPEQYEILDKLFSSLDSSIRLLRIKGTVSTFANISPKMECLTDRRFSHGHLAQLKFIFPEAIEIEKILIRDERTCCMKPDLHVSLNVSAIESDEMSKSNGSNSGSLLLRKAFRARLFKFSDAHPEGDEVPEATLPEPFNKSKQGLIDMDTIRASNFSVTNDKSVLSGQQPVPASHLSQSFRRGFSKRALSSEVVSTNLVQPVAVCQTTVLPISTPCTDLCSSEKEASTFIDYTLKSATSRRGSPSKGFPSYQPSSCPPKTPVKVLVSTKNELSSTVSNNIQVTPVKSFSTPSKALSTPAKLTSAESTPAKTLSTPAKFTSIESTPAKTLSTPAKLTSIESTPAKTLSTPAKLTSIESTPAKTLSTPAKLTSIESTPAKSISTPAKLMSATPVLQPPKRCYMSPDADSIGSPNKLVRRPQRSRSLKFDTPLKKGRVEEATESENLLVDSDIYDILPENLLQSIREKENKALEDQDPAISQAKRRQQMIASLPKLFDMIHYFFQSIKRSAITKNELMHQIISSHLDIVDRREIEEQLILLQELAPEWIYEKSASTGGLLLCINKISSPESVRARLAEAR